QPLLAEANELTKIVAKSVLTAKGGKRLCNLHFAISIFQWSEATSIHASLALREIAFGDFENTRR
ncbi:MAG: hypothetical protein ACPL4I_06955, partial [Bacteroidota bacterium]